MEAAVFKLSKRVAESGSRPGDPCAVIKKAFEIGLIEDGAAWLKGLEDRNLSSHIYNEQIAREIETMISDIYAPLFHALEARLLTKINNEA